MTDHELTLVIHGDLADEIIAGALFEAGCDDATFGVVDGIGYGEFLREAPSYAAAVLSAVDQVESIQGLQVMRVEPDDIVAALNAALGLRRQAPAMADHVAVKHVLSLAS